ncbi:MAG TPA: hypothetical protein PLF27_10255 [Sedimentibacter sp.]|nr:hypothetical protein [Sedimentibacter sp.]
MFTDKKQNKEYLINFKVTEEQKETIKQMAKSKNMTISKLIMFLLEEEYKKQNNPS